MRRRGPIGQTNLTTVLSILPVALTAIALCGVTAPDPFARTLSSLAHLPHRPKGAQVVGTAAETVIYRFGGGSDGAYPVASLTADATGTLYGLTQGGGTHGLGTLFKLTPVGTGYTKSTLYNFAGGSDGAMPIAGLIADTAGALYGTTSAGGGCAAQGGGCGTVFKLALTGTSMRETVLYRFNGGSDGIRPTGTLIGDAGGALYGTTTAGGTPGGFGTVFELVPARSGYDEHVLYRFKGGSDGANPIDGNGLLADAEGSLYGTTYSGGSANCSLGCGTVFELLRDTAGFHEYVLHRFQAADGANPAASLVADSGGTFYGTTQLGGRNGFGVIFKVVPPGVESTIHAFSSSAADGFEPTTQLIVDAAGSLYGTSAFGGSCGIAPFYSCGNAFKFSVVPGGYKESILVNFLGGSDGDIPEAGLVGDPSGMLYGTTEFGGGSTACPIGCGTVFKVTQSAVR